jgi:hypothetical protein
MQRQCVRGTNGITRASALQEAILPRKQFENRLIVLAIMPRRMDSKSFYFPVQQKQDPCKHRLFGAARDSARRATSRG